MPAMNFDITWPDGRAERCYSPSTVISEHIESGQSYTVAEFSQRCEQALHAASERVAQKYGYACSSAMDQLGRIQRSASHYQPTEQVRVERISPWGGDH